MSKQQSADSAQRNLVGFAEHWIQMLGTAAPADLRRMATDPIYSPDTKSLFQDVAEVAERLLQTSRLQTGRPGDGPLQDGG